MGKFLNEAFLEKGFEEKILQLVEYLKDGRTQLCLTGAAFNHLFSG